jgi:hypothetical protein
MFVKQIQNFIENFNNQIPENDISNIVSLTLMMIIQTKRCLKRYFLNVSFLIIDFHSLQIQDLTRIFYIFGGESKSARCPIMYCNGKKSTVPGKKLHIW